MHDQEFTAKAQTYWTDERTIKVTGGRKWLLLPKEAPHLLRVMGLLNADASMSADSLRKFSQVNHMLTLLRPHLEDMATRHPCVTVLDACCGTSFLSLIVTWFYKERLKHPCRVIGIDFNEKVIAASRERAARVGYEDDLKFAAGDLAAIDWPSLFEELFSESPTRPHVAVALHACDTASDHALALGIRLAADVMAVAPCCQGELARRWKSTEQRPGHPFAPIHSSPHFRRALAADLTDVFRTLLTRSRGYEVTPTEFVPSSHTPKNRLLLCVRRGRYLEAAAKEYEQLKNAVGGEGITLEDLLTNQGQSGD